MHHGRPQAATHRNSESRKQYSEVLNRVCREEEQMVIEKNGIPVAAIVPMSVVHDAAATEKRRAALRAAFAATRADFRGITSNDIEREIERSIAEVEEGESERRERGANGDAATLRRSGWSWTSTS